MIRLGLLNRIDTVHRPAPAPGRRRLAGLGRDDRGAIAVEWALVAMFLGTLMLGAFSYGTAALHKMQMANAVRAGLQYVVVRKPVQGDLTQIRTTVLNAAPPDLLDTRSLTVTLFCQCPDGSSVDCDGNCTTDEPMTFISIKMNEKYDTLVKFPFAPNRLDFTAEGTVRLN